MHNLSHEWTPRLSPDYLLFISVYRLQIWFSVSLLLFFSLFSLRLSLFVSSASPLPCLSVSPFCQPSQDSHLYEAFYLHLQIQRTLWVYLFFFFIFLSSRRSIELSKATSGGVPPSSPSRASSASLNPLPSSSSSPLPSFAEGQASSLPTDRSSMNPPSFVYGKRSSETTMDDKVAKEREHNRAHECREAGEKREGDGVITPAEGLRPLPFSMDVQ